MIDKPSLSIEDYEICNKLKSMRFSGMAEALEEAIEAGRSAYLSGLGR